MMNEVDRIVREHPELDYNRQQFVESAVREKIERIVVLASARANNDAGSQMCRGMLCFDKGTSQHDCYFISPIYRQMVAPALAVP